jgi:hypothetical protein
MPSKSSREYTGGSRNQRFRKIQKGIYVKERIAWVSTLIGQITLYFYDEGTEIADQSNEPGPTVKVLIPRLRGAAIHWELTALTIEELDAMRQFFTLAFDTAEPIVRMRDKAAQDAFTEGNDSFARVYRQLPQLVVRERPEREHDQGILDGPSDVPSGDTDGRSEGGPAGGVRGLGGELADDGAPEGVSEDDGA